MDYIMGSHICVVSSSGIYQLMSGVPSVHIYIVGTQAYVLNSQPDTATGVLQHNKGLSSERTVQTQD